MISSGIPRILDGSQNYVRFKQFISGDLCVLTLPIVVLFKPSLSLYNKIIKVGYYMAIVGFLFIPLTIFLYGDRSSYGTEQLTRTFSCSAALFFLISPYQNLKKQQLIFVLFVISIILLMAFGRRNMLVYFFSVLFFSYINFIIYYRFKHIKIRVLYIKLLFISIIGGTIFMLNIDSFSEGLGRFSEGFDSRIDIIDDMVNDFNATPADWIHGRGLYGEFTTAHLSNNDNGTRDGIENGYLTHILFGGAIYTLLLALIGIPAIYLGLFKSKNILAKAFAFLILIYFIDMVGFGLSSINFKYFIVWVSISGCYSKELRNLPDVYIKPFLNLV